MRHKIKGLPEFKLKNAKFSLLEKEYTFDELRETIKKLIDIDYNNLEIECKMHPGIYFEVSELFNKYLRIQKKYYSKLFIEIKKDPAKFKIDKISEKVIELYIYKDITYNELRTVKHTLENAVKSLDTKKILLQEAIKLWIGQYYSGPKEPKNVLNLNNRNTDKYLNDRLMNIEKDQLKKLRRKRRKL